MVVVVVVDTYASEQKPKDPSLAENMTVPEIATVVVVGDLQIENVNMIVDWDLVDWTRDFDFDFHLCLGFDSSYRCGCDCGCVHDDRFASSSVHRTRVTIRSRFLHAEYPQ